MLTSKIEDTWYGMAEVEKEYPYYVNVIAPGTWLDVQGGEIFALRFKQ